MVHMVRHEALTAAVMAALDAWPLSGRDLASRAGVPHATLVKIAREQLGASEDVAERVLAALDAWREEQKATAREVASAGRSIRGELRRTQRRTTDTEA
jgi:predicted transcriptional regulator